MLQPTTKALAQMLAGNTRASGQLVHARTMLERAERLIEERQVDRLYPAQREEFLEQLARLKLTLADADGLQDEFVEEDEEEEEAPKAVPPSPEKLRAIALSLATSIAQDAAAAQAARSAPPPVEEPEEEVPPPVMPRAPEKPVRAPVRPGSPRAARLRLKSETRAEDAPAGRTEKAPVD
ncbi:hypothetical protein [Marinimicrococcus flavescens]|uniref:Uncharacterized protein n=1 Tax=Marinimicrococcus flavescens TaxID=3031815 RepID=A0AAP4D5E7_9PROT|nr:hypothetical protein [Marinimicrococcus flavescens]